jgi:hypothetical protein
VLDIADDVDGCVVVVVVLVVDGLTLVEDVFEVEVDVAG